MTASIFGLDCDSHISCPEEPGADAMTKVHETYRKNAKPSNKAWKTKKNIRFGHIEIFEFPRTLGDNPAVSGGPPISLARLATNVMRVSLDIFEHYHRRRRSLEDIRLSIYQREKYLKKNGFSNDEIRRCAALAESKKIERMVTIYDMRCMEILKSRRSEMPMKESCRTLSITAA